MLSVLLVVNDSELDGTEGSIDARGGNSPSCPQLKAMMLYSKAVFGVGGRREESVKYESEVKREKCDARREIQQRLI
jgi:hypothetical protein